MLLNTRSLLTAALFSLLSIEAGAVVLKPIKSPNDLKPSSGLSKRDNSNDVVLKPIKDPGVLTGHFVKRAATGNGAFDPCNRAELFWGVYAGDNIVTANFTLTSPDDDEMILPIENFAQHLKSIKCGPNVKGMILEFNDKDQFTYAQKKWQWIDEKDPNHFVLVTEESQCYAGDDRSPYLVKNIVFDDSKLTATVDGEERPWAEVAQEFDLNVGHTYVDPATVNVTHPQLLKHKREDKKFSLAMSYDKPIFEYKKDSKETAGMRISANAKIETGGNMIADFSIHKSKIMKIPEGVDITIKPQGAWGQLLLTLQLDGKLGKAFDWSLKPNIGIPVGGFKIANIVEIGPIAEMGLHFGSTALEGVATFSTGAKAKLKDSAVATFKMNDKSKNGVNNDWAPTFEKVDPRFTAEIKGGVKAWAELSFKVKAEALGFGYEAGVEAELPYISAEIAAKVDTKAGVCNSKKAMGLEIDCGVGINVHLEAGQPDKSPDFEKDLFDTKWPLYKTCMGFGNDITTTSVGAPPVSGPKTTTGKTTGSVIATSKAASGTVKPTSGSASGSVKPTSSPATTAKPSTGSNAATGTPASKSASSGVASSSKVSTSAALLSSKTISSGTSSVVAAGGASNVKTSSIPSGSASLTGSSKIPLSTGSTTNRGPIPIIPYLPSLNVSSILAPTAPIASTSAYAPVAVSSYVAQTTLPTSVA
ncbi:hypothetical protein P280DRAFT_545663 [Massarina eburnea CBS 473.64]|uniref:Uncharacterized protein n=1 Tax=Massarina eburnea CBS 473.64 TaxID=1395130 RepID=A0A6A6SH19_9PLEO|nr:hypothetical protein P280DRAFT_545663 [Massarina eburnea CBS 473.64]